MLRPAAERHCCFLALVLAASACHAAPRCTSWIEQTSDRPTPADLALPVVGQIVDTGLVSESRGGCSEYSDQVRKGTLGPLGIEYATWDYKGQPLTDGMGAQVFDPACPSRRVAFKMDNGAASVKLRGDPARGLYFISSGSAAAQTVVVRVVTGSK